MKSGFYVQAKLKKAVIKTTFFISILRSY